MNRARPAPEDFSFRLVDPDDLPLLERWRAADHVQMWWGAAEDLRSEYLSRSEPDFYYVACLGDQPIGLIQHYHWRDFPKDARGIGACADEDGFDYFLGEAEMIGRGLGPAMLSAFLAQVVAQDPGIHGVRLDVAEANRRSWRCLEKLGFRRVQEGVSVPGEPGPHYVYALRPLDQDRP